MKVKTEKTHDFNMILSFQVMQEQLIFLKQGLNTKSRLYEPC